MVDTLPAVAETLSPDARLAAESDWKAFRGQVEPPLPCPDLARASESQRFELLWLCALDLALTTFFDEVFAHTTDKEVSSLLVDAVLYQATGLEAEAATEAELLVGETYRKRGIHKYSIAGQKLRHLGDSAGFLFGQEVAAVVCDSPLDIAVILPASLTSPTLRLIAGLHIRSVVFGIAPAQDDFRRIETVVAEARSKLTDMLEKGIRLDLMRAAKKEP
jgi:hypothetical protein